MNPTPEASLPPYRRALLVPLAVVLFPFVLMGALVLGLTEKRQPLP